MEGEGEGGYGGGSSFTRAHILLPGSSEFSSELPLPSCLPLHTNAGALFWLRSHSVLPACFPTTADDIASFVFANPSSFGQEKENRGLVQRVADLTRSARGSKEIFDESS